MGRNALKGTAVFLLSVFLLAPKPAASTISDDGMWGGTMPDILCSVVIALGVGGLAYSVYKSRSRQFASTDPVRALTESPQFAMIAESHGRAKAKRLSLDIVGGVSDGKLLEKYVKDEKRREEINRIGQSERAEFLRHLGGMSDHKKRDKEVAKIVRTGIVARIIESYNAAQDNVEAIEAELSAGRNKKITQLLVENRDRNQGLTPVLGTITH